MKKITLFAVVATIALSGCEVQHKHTHEHHYGSQPIIPRDKDGKIIIELRPVRPQEPRR